MYSLSLASNQLDGTVPALESAALIFLDLSDNRLHGTMPSLSGVPNLAQIDIGDNAFIGEMPDVPYPDYLETGYSRLCPNMFDPIPNPDWDEAVGLVPWYAHCTSPDKIFADGFDAP